MTSGIARKAAIAGIGATEFSTNSGRSEMRLCTEAIQAALADAGIPSAQVDGLCTMTMDNNRELEVFRNIGGRTLKFFSQIGFGGTMACGPIQQAAMAIATGIADVVVCYRAMNERSEYRFGQGYRVSAGERSATTALFGLHTWQGLMPPGAMIAIWMQRYMHEFGLGRDDFAPVSLAARRHAAKNPKARFYQKPITLDDYLRSEMISDPFRLLDYCLESDGAVALVITSAERARDLKQKPALISGAAMGAPGGTISVTNFYDVKDPLHTLKESRLVADQLYAMADITASDIDAAMIYDHFGPTVLPQLEAYGFCAPGEAKDFIKDGGIEIDGHLPVNTHGGMLGEAYIHGFNSMAEGVRQIRGTAANQVTHVNNVLVVSGSHGATSGFILSSG